MQPHAQPDEPTGGENLAQDAPDTPGWGSPSAATGEPAGRTSQDSRAEAIQRLQKKRGWTSAMVAYVVVNAFLIGIWAVTGRGYFWPGWVLGGWGIGMVMSFWDIFVRRPISEADIEGELHRGSSS
jgi:hypothetical protein